MNYPQQPKSIPPTLLWCLKNVPPPRNRTCHDAHNVDNLPFRMDTTTWQRILVQGNATEFLEQLVEDGDVVPDFLFPDIDLASHNSNSLDCVTELSDDALATHWKDVANGGLKLLAHKPTPREVMAACFACEAVAKQASAYYQHTNTNNNIIWWQIGWCVEESNSFRDHNIRWPGVFTNISSDYHGQMLPCPVN